MANQMIALGVRGPQLPNLGNMAQQFANTMAATATARERRGAAERQMQFRQLVGSEGFDAGNPEHIRAAAALDPAGAEALGRSFTTRRAADQEFDTREMVRLRNLGVAVMRAADPEAAYQSWLTEVEAADPRSGALFRQASPTYQPEFMTNVLMEAEQYIDKTIATPTVQGRVDAQGNFRGDYLGGTRPPGSYEVPEINLVPTDTGGGVGTPAAGTPAVGRRAAETGLNARPGEMPRQMVGRGIRAENVPTGSPLVRPMEETAPGLTPASAGGGIGGVQPLDMQTAPLIIQNAVQNRVIDPTHLQQLREMVGPENERNLAAWMQQHQIRIQPPGEAPIQPGMRSAEYRPDMAPAPQFQQVQAAPPGMTYQPTGRASTGRNPTVGQYPGEDLVSIERSAERAGAEAGARGAVEVQTAAPIAAGRGEAERIVRLRERMPDLHFDAEAAVSNLTKRIEAVDRYLRHPYRHSIIGTVEGNLPRVAQVGVRADMQSLWDLITNNEVLRSIVETRAQTPTGGSLVGPVSNRDLDVLIQAATPLNQTGEPRTQEVNMQQLRRELYAARDRIIRRYENTVRPLGAEARTPEYRLNVPQVAPEYRREQRRGAGAGATRTPSRTRGGATVSNW